MTRFNVLSLVFATLVANGALADGPTPRKMFDYLKPGMHIGIEQIEGSTQLAFNVYTEGRKGDQSKLLTARSLQRGGKYGLDADRFAKSHPSIQARLAEAKNDTEGTLQIRIVPSHRAEIARIVVIGDDYVLVEMDREGIRRLLPKKRIAQIDLNSDPAALLFARPEDLTQE